jgi:hypothetical protein
MVLLLPPTLPHTLTTTVPQPLVLVADTSLKCLVRDLKFQHFTKNSIIS